MDQNQNLIRLRGSRTRREPCDIKDVDIEVEVVEGAIQSDYFWWVSLLLNGIYSSLTHCELYLTFLFFSDFYSDYLSRNAIDLENSFFSFIRNELF